MTERSADRIYATALAQINEFKFDERVAAVFPDMIQRSVPGYASVLQMLGVFAQRFIQPDSRVYDLGCSLGAASLSIATALGDRAGQIYAVDNSSAMLTQAKKNLSQAQLLTELNWVCADISDIEIQSASLVILNYTLQFFPIEARTALIEKIYAGLLPGGALIISEKICFKKAEKQEFYTQLHHAFKMANGYSELEISQKRQALENVLLPETVFSHKQRLSDVGFSEVSCWFQCLNFASILAIK